MVEQVEDNQIPEVTRWTTTEPTETWEITTTSSTTVSTTPTTTTTTTTPPRKYSHAFPIHAHTYICKPVSSLYLYLLSLSRATSPFEQWKFIYKYLNKNNSNFQSGWIRWNLGEKQGSPLKMGEERVGDACTRCVVSSNVENVQLLWSVWTVWAEKRDSVHRTHTRRGIFVWRASNVTKRGTVMAGGLKQR